MDVKLSVYNHVEDLKSLVKVFKRIPDTGPQKQKFVVGQHAVVIGTGIQQPLMGLMNPGSQSGCPAARTAFNNQVAENPTYVQLGEKSKGNEARPRSISVLG